MFKRAGLNIFYTSALIGCATASAKMEQSREKAFREAHPGKEIEIGSAYVGGAIIKTYRVKEPENTIETRQPCVKK